MIFQGEEHGERAPFQFFSDHIDEEIAVATREGRRREFATFAEFRGEEIPDPQDPATFARSKLTREGEPAGLRELYADLLRARRELPPGDAGEIAFDEHAGWLRVERGPFALVANFSGATRTCRSTTSASWSWRPARSRSNRAMWSFPHFPAPSSG